MSAFSAQLFVGLILNDSWNIEDFNVCEINPGKSAE